MPNLINVLGAMWGGDSEKLSEAERRAAVKQALIGDNKDDKRGMEWGTCIVYSCSKDCSSRWSEEVVYVQWDV